MDQFGMFAKYWRPGSVKSRLAATIGELAASEIYRAFLLCLVQRLGNVADRNVLAFSPHQCRDAFASLAGSGWSLIPQIDGDLGCRMQHFFAEAFAQGAQRVVLIGSDSPTIPREYIQQAFDLLRSQSVVLGPTTDGGYYLVGARESVPPIFNEVSWSSPKVWQQTLDHLDSASCSFEILPPWYDIDDDSDLRQLRDELNELVQDDPLWEELLSRVAIAV